MYMYMYICIYGIHTTERFLEVAIKVGLGLNGDLNPQPLNSVETLYPTEISSHVFKSLSELTLNC